MIPRRISIRLKTYINMSVVLVNQTSYTLLVVHKYLIVKSQDQLYTERKKSRSQSNHQLNIEAALSQVAFENSLARAVHLSKKYAKKKLVRLPWFPFPKITQQQEQLLFLQQMIMRLIQKSAR